MSLVRIVIGAWKPYSGLTSTQLLTVGSEIGLGRNIWTLSILAGGRHSRVAKAGSCLFMLQALHLGSSLLHIPLLTFAHPESPSVDNKAALLTFMNRKGHC
jgi:hypothetical protein